MNDYVIRFTPKEDDVSYKQLLGIIREAIEEGAEPSGWYIKQHGEFDEMQKSMTKERGFINVQFEKLSAEEEEQRKKDREKLKDVFISPEAMEELRNWRMEYTDDGETLSWLKADGLIPEAVERLEKERKLKENSPEAIQDCKNWLPSQEQTDEVFLEGLSDGAKRMAEVVQWQHDWGPLKYTIPTDDDCTESVTMEPEGKRWVNPTPPCCQEPPKKVELDGERAFVLINGQRCEVSDIAISYTNREFSENDLWKGPCSGIYPRQPDEVFLGNVKYEPILEEIYKGLGILNEPTNVVDRA